MKHIKIITAYAFLAFGSFFAGKAFGTNQFIRLGWPYAITALILLFLAYLTIRRQGTNNGQR